MTPWLQRMHDELVRRNYAATTIRTYLHALRTCERYHRRHGIDRLGSDALRRYQSRLYAEGCLGCAIVRVQSAAERRRPR